MASNNLIQNSFTSGELDPKLRGRSDVATYYTGAQKMRNVLCIPQGAAKRRPGLEYIDQIAFGPTKCFNFVYNKTKSFIIVLSALQALIYKDGVLVATVVTAITGAQVPNVTMAQSFDTMLFFHQDFSPIYLIRGADDATWTSDAWRFINPPTDSSGSTTTTALLRISDDSDEDIEFADWVDGNTWSDCTLLAYSNAFVAGDVGRFIRGPLGGYAKVTVVTDATHAECDILAPFTNDLSDGHTLLPAGEWSWEDLTFSAANGYPACGCFFQGRLWLASTPAVPSGIWASKTNDEEDFGNWIPAFDDNGISITARDTRTSFHQAFGGKHLMFFSADGAFFAAKSDTEPVTPSNIAVQRCSALGSEPTFPPFDVSGSMVYMRKGGKSLLESTYTFANGSYETQDLSLLASHLLVNPVAMAYRTQTSTDEADYVLVVNGDGTLAVLCTLKAQEVTSWTMCETNGSFMDVVVDGDDMYFVIDRTIAGMPKRCIEKFNSDLLLDCAKLNPGIALTSDGTALTYDDVPMTYRTEEVSTVSGLDHLNGQEVSIVLDNTVQTAQTVAAGSITLARDGEDVQVGLQFPIVDEATESRVFIQSMPIEVDTGAGNSVGKKKRLSEVMLMLYETSHVIVNKNKATIRRIGVDHLDSPVPKRSENIPVSGLLGWDDEITISVGQTLPLPMTLLGLSYRVRT